MGVAAYNRGTKLIRALIDRELAERNQSVLRNEITCHQYVDSRTGETVSVWCDSVGALVNQNRDENGNVIRYI